MSQIDHQGPHLPLLSDSLLCVLVCKGTHGTAGDALVQTDLARIQVAINDWYNARYFSADRSQEKSYPMHRFIRFSHD